MLLFVHKTVFCLFSSPSFLFSTVFRCVFYCFLYFLLFFCFCAFCPFFSFSFIFVNSLFFIFLLLLFFPAIALPRIGAFYFFIPMSVLSISFCRNPCIYCILLFPVYVQSGHSEIPLKVSCLQFVHNLFIICSHFPVYMRYTMDR